MNYLHFHPVIANIAIVTRPTIKCFGRSATYNQNEVQKIVYNTTTILHLVEVLYRIAQCFHIKVLIALRTFQNITKILPIFTN